MVSGLMLSRSIKFAAVDERNPALALFYDGKFYSLKKLERSNYDLRLEKFYASFPFSLEELLVVYDDVITSEPVADLSSKLLAPNPYPSKIIGIGKNYKRHIKEMNLGNKPSFFLKAPSSLIGHNNSIVVPPFVKKPDYEGEVVLLIGRRVKNASPHEAKKAIIGYSAGNDVTARDLQYGDEPLPWSQAKSIDTFTPIGPYVKILEDYSELEEVCVKTFLNGSLVQEGCPDDMILDYAHIVAEASRLMTIYPGDFIFTGTPAGVGHATGKYLKDGDKVKVEVSGIDPLVNRVSIIKEAY